MLSKSKRRWSMRAAAGFMGLIVSMGLAFFLTTYVGDGSHEGKTGTHGAPKALAVVINFPTEQLTPTNRVEVTANLENTSGKALTFKSFPMKVETPTVPKCGSEWLILSAEGSTLTGGGYANVIKGTNEKSLDPIPTGTNVILDNGGKIWLEFDPSKTAATDQSSCEGIPVKVSGHLE